MNSIYDSVDRMRRVASLNESAPATTVSRPKDDLQIAGLLGVNRRMHESRQVPPAAVQALSARIHQVTGVQLPEGQVRTMAERLIGTHAADELGRLSESQVRALFAGPR